MSDSLSYRTPETTVELQFLWNGLVVLLDGHTIARFDVNTVWDTTKRWISNMNPAPDEIPLLRRKLEAQIAHTASIHIANLITAIEAEHEE